MQEESYRIHNKIVDPYSYLYSYLFACLCAQSFLFKEMQILPEAPLDFERKLFEQAVEYPQFYSIPILENMPGLKPEKKEFAEGILAKLKEILGKNIKKRKGNRLVR